MNFGIVHNVRFNNNNLQSRITTMNFGIVHNVRFNTIIYSHVMQP